MLRYIPKIQITAVNHANFLDIRFTLWAMSNLGSVSSRECLDAPAILATFTAGRTGLVIV